MSEVTDHKAAIGGLVAAFAAALYEKLLASEEKYGWQGGWARNDWRNDLHQQLLQHVMKGDPVDVAAYCAFAWHHGWATSLPPLPMLLFCPQCGTQHIDAPDEAKGWTNPPHRSHQCQSCDCIWRPADVPTTGVLLIATSGKADNWQQAHHRPPFTDGEPYICEACSKPVLHGQFINQWDDIGPAHADCDAPFARPKQATVAINECGQEGPMRTFVMLGTPMLLVDVGGGPA
jgi:hypothetical protein